MSPYKLVYDPELAKKERLLQLQELEEFIFMVTKILSCIRRRVEFDMTERSKSENFYQGIKYCYSIQG
ncbi:hypothetical protein EPI10_020671 [Gossypium australe]|uniref:Uncharacterized protein n=1 Tax=Gossypium australe TaxID=47621 RepID=A0A5B6WEJ0_9ROSI|nr:hypothetical protein EPI10_020671 [Gossypium australe]